MNGSIRVAAVQLRAHDHGEFPGVIEQIVATAESAAARADLVVLPEATFPAYVLGTSEFDEAAVDVAIERLRAIAAATKTVIVVGVAVRSDGALRNAALAIDSDGSVAGRADKLFLWHFDRRWFSAGDRVEKVRTSLATLGMLVCADGRLPTVARALVDAGADVLVMPTAWVTSGRDPRALENVQADLLARVRAYENRVPFIAANKCGSELGIVAYCGKSQIVAADGDVVAIAGEDAPETLLATIAAGPARPQRVGRADPPPCASFNQRLRLAISCDPLCVDVDRRLEYLDDAYALSPSRCAHTQTALRELPAAFVADDLMSDPAGLLPYRKAGYTLICWSTSLDTKWAERLGRARALELKLYVIVFDRSIDRAYAIDPDGAIVAGTFDGYRLASFLFDPNKAGETTVAPGTDVLEGLDRIAELIERASR